MNRTEAGRTVEYWYARPVRHGTASSCNETHGLVHEARSSFEHVESPNAVIIQGNRPRLTSSCMLGRLGLIKLSSKTLKYVSRYLPRYLLGTQQLLSRRLLVLCSVTYGTVLPCHCSIRPGFARSRESAAVNPQSSSLNRCNNTMSTYSLPSLPFSCMPPPVVH